MILPGKTRQLSGGRGRFRNGHSGGKFTGWLARHFIGAPVRLAVLPCVSRAADSSWLNQAQHRCKKQCSQPNQRDHKANAEDDDQPSWHGCRETPYDPADNDHRVKIADAASRGGSRCGFSPWRLRRALLGIAGTCASGAVLPRTGKLPEVLDAKVFSTAYMTTPRSVVHTATGVWSQCRGL